MTTEAFFNSDSHSHNTPPETEAVLRCRLRQAETQLEFNALIISTLDVVEIYRRAARSFTEQLRVARCAISKWDKNKNAIITQMAFVQDLSTGHVGEQQTEYDTYNLDGHKGTQYVLQTHAPLIRTVDDPDLEASEREILEELGHVTVLELPLIQDNDPIGIIELYRNESQPPFAKADITLAQAMSQQMSIALHNAQLASETRARVAQLSVLNRISTMLSTAPTLKDVFKAARKEIMSLVEATGMSILVIDEDEETFRWIYGYEYGQELDTSKIPLLPLTGGFTGQVYKTGDVVFFNKELEEKRQQFGSFTVGAEPSVWAGFPLIVANKLIGVLSVENETDPNAFGKEYLELIETMSGPIAIAINNLMQFEEIERALVARSEQRVQLQTAAEVAAAASSMRELDDLLQKSVDLIRERFSLYYVGLFLIDTDDQDAALKAGTGEAGQLQIEQRHRLKVGGRSLIGGTTADGKPRIIQNVTNEEEWRPNPALPGTRAELALPLRVRGRVIGALTVQSTRANAFSEELVQILQTMSDQLAVAIENVQLLAATEARAHRQQQLNRISARLHRSVDINEIVHLGVQALSEELDGARVQLQLGMGRDSKPHAQE